MHLPKLFVIAQVCLTQCLPSLGKSEDRVTFNRLASRHIGVANGVSDGHNARESESGHLKESQNYEVSFYHINDVHAHLDEFSASGSTCTDPASEGCVGGYARVKAILEEQRPQKKNSLFLNAGDEFQGTLFYTIYKGEKIAETLNQLGFDAMTLGNHEFDDGDDLLAEFLANLTFPVVSSNTHTLHPQLSKHLMPYKVFPQHDLALLGITTETTASISNPSNLTTFEDPLNATRRTVELIKETYPHVNKIVALTHIGYEEDIRLAQNTTGISLIIGGHSHTLLGNITGAAGPYPTITTNLDGEEVLVVTAYRWGEYLGYIDIEYDPMGKIVSYEGGPIHLTNDTELEPNLESEIKEWEKAFVPFENTIIGVTQTDLDDLSCQNGTECTLGDITADALEAYRPGPVGAIMNSGGIRIPIDAGNITEQQALDCFPFGNAYVQLQFTGEQLWNAFESIVSGVSVDNGGPVAHFVQVSKDIRLTYNPSNPSGSKLITLTIAEQPVVSSQSYLISTVDYLARGGDNFWPARSDSEFTILETVDTVFAEFVQANSPLNYQLDGRIAMTDETNPQKDHP